MTVLVIIALMSSAVVLTLPGNKTTTLTFAEAMTRELNAVSQNGMISGHPTAVGLSEDGYALLAFENGNWVEHRGSEWPEGVIVQFDRSEQRIELGEDIIPLVVFNPTGSSTVFRLGLRDFTDDINIESDGDGRVKMVARYE